MIPHYLFKVLRKRFHSKMHRLMQVLGKQILHHLDMTQAVPEIARVLRPGGRAVFLEPLIHNPLLEGY